MNKPIKKLSLARETIRNLQPDEMGGVVGGTDSAAGCVTLVSAIVTVSLVISVKASCVCKAQ